MNRTKLKAYAPQARQDFIQAVNDRAAFYGITGKNIEPVTHQGDVAIIKGKAFPKAIIDKRKKLSDRIERLGFDQVMEAVAYTWFNRFVAIRYMELHGYLDHGYRVLSHPENKELPEILEHATDVDFTGLKKEKVLELKLDGTKDNELYRMLLIAQCNDLNKAMPFLFGRVDDESELLLPENLLHTESLIRKLVTGIDEDDWQEVEIIGWLYQFYISEKKDQVIGKVVKSEDIPAATQLFTPNWIVKYMVQNTLGRKWLATYPNSSIRDKMEFYIEPAEQEPEVVEQLNKITPESLNPEEITFLDPACGSGHILVEAFELFKAIYQERGYRLRDIPKLILEKNLFALEIDDRAAQLASLSLLLKARADDRRIFDREVQPQVVSIQQTNGMDAAEIAGLLTGEQVRVERTSGAQSSLFSETYRQTSLSDSITKKSSEDHRWLGLVLHDLIDTFQDAKTFGSLITIPKTLRDQLPKLKNFLDQHRDKDMWVQTGISMILDIVSQADLLSRSYDFCVANPPYMGSGSMNLLLKKFIKHNFEKAAGDVATSFILRNPQFIPSNGIISMITFQNWMFVGTFAPFRQAVLQDCSVASLVHNGRGVWGSDFGSCAFCLAKPPLQKSQGVFIRLFKKNSTVQSNNELIRKFFNRTSESEFLRKSYAFLRIPGNPLAYWLSEELASTFKVDDSMSFIAEAKTGLSYGKKDQFSRKWTEVDISKVCFHATSSNDYVKSNYSWAPVVSGGSYRKWYGNFEEVVLWKNDGEKVKNYQGSTIRNPSYYFREGITWSDVTISNISFRFVPPGFIISDVGPMAFCHDNKNLQIILGLGNTSFVEQISKALNPTVHFKTGDFLRIPFVRPSNFQRSIIDECVKIARDDWDCFERSWDFQSFPLLKKEFVSSMVIESWKKWKSHCDENIRKMKLLESNNNRQFHTELGLQDIIKSELEDEKITLYRANKTDDVKCLFSYISGCMMGRYSLDKPGLIYAHSGNKGFDPSNYTTFPADDDGIVPITEIDWFDDDAANRFIKFISVAWAEEHLEENLEFIADSLDRKKNEQPRDTIRRYFQNSFFKDHLKTYKKRPIYWLFSSGKQKAFQCLVYLHRYNEGTLSRMRTEYVIPLQGKIASRIEQLERDIPAAESTSHQKKLRKEREKLSKQQDELLKFDEKLRHYADLRISLDLDDGVKVNYGKFGDLLAEVKTVTGKKPEMR